MKKKTVKIAVGGIMMIICSSCGFKSDLYLPGQPEKVEQYDRESLKNLGDETLRTLQSQSEDTALQERVDIPDTGVLVELPSAEDAAQEKADSRKKVAEKN